MGNPSVVGGVVLLKIDTLPNEFSKLRLISFSSFLGFHTLCWCSVDLVGRSNHYGARGYGFWRLAIKQWLA